MGILEYYKLIQYSLMDVKAACDERNAKLESDSDQQLVKNAQNDGLDLRYALCQTALLRYLYQSINMLK